MPLLHIRPSISDQWAPLPLLTIIQNVSTNHTVNPLTDTPIWRVIRFPSIASLSFSSGVAQFSTEQAAAAAGSGKPFTCRSVLSTHHPQQPQNTILYGFINVFRFVLDDGWSWPAQSQNRLIKLLSSLLSSKLFALLDQICTQIHDLMISRSR